MWKRHFVLYIPSFIHVCLVSFAGYTLSLGPSPPDIGALSHIVMFGITSKLFSVMFSNGDSRRMKTFSTLPFLASCAILGRLQQSRAFMGMLILALYALRPLFEKAALDLLHHALRYVLLFLLAYDTYSLGDPALLPALLAVTLFSVAGELVSGLRMRSEFRGTVLSLGYRKSLLVAIVALAAAMELSMCVFNSIFEFPIQIGDLAVPFYLAPSLGVTYVLARPMVKAFKGEHLEVFSIVRKREVLIAAILSIVMLTTLFAGEIDIDEKVETRGLGFNVKIRTIIAGKYDWNVPWILFDYIDQGNYYYFLLHKDGILELGRVVDGKYEGYVASLKERVNAFQTHEFNVFLNSSIIIIMDGKYELRSPRPRPSNTSRIKIASARPCPWLAQIDLVTSKAS